MNFGVANFKEGSAPQLPRVLPDDPTVALDLFTRERASIRSDAVRLRNQIHALLMQLDPQFKEHLPDLRSKGGLNALIVYHAPRLGPLQEARGASIRRIAERLCLAREQAADLGRQIKTQTVEAGFTPLTGIRGVNLLTAGTLAEASSVPARASPVTLPSLPMRGSHRWKHRPLVACATG